MTLNDLEGQSRSLTASLLKCGLSVLLQLSTAAEL